MFYLRTKIAEEIEIKIPLYNDEIFTQCRECGKEINYEPQELVEILHGGDFASTSVICSDCFEKMM